jgi:hypothetical protein
VDIKAKTMTSAAAKVLSWNPDGRTLLPHELALRQQNFEVLSVSTPLDARFEIEKGKARVFLASYVAPIAIYRDLASLFRRRSADGIVIFVTQNPGDRGTEADIILSEDDEPHAVVEKLLGMGLRSAKPEETTGSHGAK